MDKKFFIYIGLIIVGVYFISPVPYCKVVEKEIDIGDALYTAMEVEETKNITFTLLNVRGESMFPAIQDNSECLCIKKENYDIGDIIFFFASINGEFTGISHRIVSFDSGKIFTKGDKNNFIDPPMTKESIICSIPTTSRFNLLVR